MRLEITAKIGSDDAEDIYDFVLEELAAQVVVNWQLHKVKDSGVLTLANKTLETASAVFWMDQGTVFRVDKAGAVSSHKSTGKLAALPAFLFGRKAYEQLVAGKSAYVHALWGTGGDSVKTTAGTQTLTVAGKKHKVPVLLVESEETQLVILRSRQWPLVLSRKEAGDNFLDLIKLSELPPLDDKALPEAAKPPVAKAKQPVSEVLALVLKLANENERRRVTRELNELVTKRDVSDEIVDALEQGKYLALPASESSMSKKSAERSQLISLLRHRPGKRGEALLRRLAQPSTEVRLCSHAASVLLDAMAEDRIPRDEPWITAQVDAIDGTNDFLWNNAVEAAALLGPKYFYERFAPFLDAQRMTEDEDIERINTILLKYGDGEGQDRRWKKTLKPLCKHRELGRQIERALGV